MLANGFPKAGNHALVKAMQLLGIPASVNHIPYADRPGGPCIMVKRDPRNIIVAYLRWVGQPVTPGMFLSYWRHFMSDSLDYEMADYQGWLTDPDTLVVRFEDLIATDAAMRQIAEFSSVPYLHGAFEALPGMTRTWHAEHSDYRTIWTDEVDSAWSREGGPELCAAWGY